MDLKFYFKIKDRISQKSDIFVEYSEKDKHKLILKFDESLNYKGHDITELKPKDYKEYVFISTSPKGNNKFIPSTQLVSIFGLNKLIKKNKKNELDYKKLNDRISKFIKNIKTIFDLDKKEKLKNEEKIKKDIIKVIEEDFEKNNKKELSIQVVTFEINNKKPIQIDKVKEKINELFSEILGKEKLKEEVECYLCGRKTKEVFSNFNYIFLFYTSKKRDLVEKFLTYSICLDCAKELYKIKDTFLLYEKILLTTIKGGGNKNTPVFLTFLFYDPKEDILEDIIVSIINKIAVSMDNVNFHTIKDIVDQLTVARSIEPNKLNKIVFDILIFLADGSSYSVKKYIPYIELHKFLDVLQNYEKDVNGKFYNYLDFNNFLKALKWEENPQNTATKIVFNVYVDFLYSLLKNRLRNNKNLIRKIIKLLTKRFKNLNYPLKNNVIFINLKQTIEEMEDKDIIEFSYLIGKLGKIYALTKAEERLKRQKVPEEELRKKKWIEARKIFARILLTKRYNTARDLLKAYDYLYSKLSHLESYVPSEVEVLRNIKEKLDKKITDEIVKYFMIYAFEENEN